MPTVPDNTWMIEWAEANSLDPSRVVDGSVEIIEERIFYREAFRTNDGSWSQRRRFAPLVVGFEEFRDSKR